VKEQRSVDPSEAERSRFDIALKRGTSTQRYQSIAAELSSALDAGGACCDGFQWHDTDTPRANAIAEFVRAVEWSDASSSSSQETGFAASTRLFAFRPLKPTTTPNG
jgi:hypothetical protein